MPLARATGAPVVRVGTRTVRSLLFDDVPRQLVANLVAGGTIRTLAAGEALLQVGSENATLFVILSGELSIHLPGADRVPMRFGPGDCVGELSVLDGQPVSANVVAEAAVEVLGLDAQQVWTLIEASPVAARNLLRILAGRVRMNSARLADASRRWSTLEQIATVDGLTGLRNRRWLEEAFARYAARANHTGAPLTLLMIDIDHFKVVNDQHGHQAGDSVLQQVARTLTDTLRPQDLLARYGGEEFTAMLPDVSLDRAAGIAERLRATLERTMRTKPIPVTVSIGAASLRPDEAFGDLVARADEALYEAKRTGRNRVCVE